MDREGLLQELKEYKVFSLQQYEQIRLLKVEIMKIKKLAAQKGVQVKPGEKNTVSWVNNNDSNLLRGKDAKSLQEEVNSLREMVNGFQEEKKILIANAQKYERRAKYTLQKFNEIKDKELQLIQHGEDKVKGDVFMVEGKFKKKIETLNDKVKELTDQNVQYKTRIEQQSSMREYRVKYEKANKQNKTLEKKIKILQVELMQTTTDNELKKQLADTMAEEDRKRKKKE